MPAVCPSCNKDDRIQKLSVLVQSGTSTGTFSGPTGGATYSDGKWGTVGGYSFLDAQSVTDLARLLAPPKEPRLPGGYGWIKWGCLAMGGLISLVGVCVAVGVFAPIAGAVAAQEGSPASAVPAQLSIACMSFLVPAALGALTFFIGANTDNNSKKQYDYDKPRWDQAIARWNRLYFCARDAIVIDPDTQATCQPNGLQQFIYS